MNFSVSQIIAALLAVAGNFVPVPLRWLVKIVADLFKQKAATMTAAASAETVTLSAPDELKEIVAQLFASLKEFVSGRPFILSVVTALEKFVLNNLLDAIFDQLTTGGTRLAAGAVPMHYAPEQATAFGEEVEAALALDS